MRYCKNCGAAVDDAYSFCANCGAPMTNNKITASNARNLSRSGMETPPKRSKGAVIAACVSSGVVVIIMIALVIFVFSSDNRSRRHSSKDDDKAQETEAPEVNVPGELKFTAQSYEIEVNQETDMSKYLTCQGIDPANVVWSANSDQVIVGSNGRVVINDYSVNSVLTATDKDDPSITTNCAVATRSSQDDLVYRVQGLNGAHKEDVTSDQGVVSVASTAADDYNIDLTPQNKQPAKRSKKYKWDRKLFYTLEDVSQESDKDGKINSYRIEKKQFKNAKTGNQMEYEIYHNPETDVINKIVSIEHMDKILEITEYYFTDKGAVNFVFVHKDVNYVPDYAQISKKGERYLFHKDTLVNWRVVDDSGEHNYCYGNIEKKALSGHAGIKEYAKCSKERQNRFDEKEIQVLNAAYNTLNKVTSSEGVSSIRGYVNDQNGDAMDEASVKLKSTDSGSEVFQGNTNEEGYYEIYVPARKMSYEISFEKESYMPETLYHIDSDTDQIGIYQETISMAQQNENEYDCYLSFYDALNRDSDGYGMEQLENVDVKIRKGANNTDGETVYEMEHIDYSCTVNLQPGMYTIEMTRNQYMITYSSIFVSPVSENNIDIYATPKLGKDELRVVLTWGDTPRDLDSHLFVPASSEEDYHICYYKMSNSDYSAALDVDDTDGYGPETTSIYKLKRGQYKFYVADFTNCCQNQEESYEMSNSNATVRVYGKKGLLHTFFVPTNRPGVIWEVFEIRDGNVIPTQRYYDAIGNKTWWSSAK